MRKIILGTDWWTDCDDAVALRLLAKAANMGEIDLLGIVINACMPYSVASLRGFLAAENSDAENSADHPASCWYCGIPVGIDRAATDFGGNPPYQKRLAETFFSAGTNEEAEDGVLLYRRLLAAADSEVELVEIGYPQVLSALLESVGDDISPLSGVELVRTKVKKIWMMAGKWDKDGERENNFARNARSREAAEKFCRMCPVTVTFLGWEVGASVITGGKLSRADHLYHVLADHGSENGRSSWDPMLVLLAVIGDENAAGYDTVVGTASVDRETGANRFVPHGDGMHRYVVKRYEDSFYADAIDRWIGKGENRC